MLGLTTGAKDSVDPGESSLRSDMLMSIAMLGSGVGVGIDNSRFSVRHSIHIGLAPADLRLEPADEEMAKGMYNVHVRVSVYELLILCTIGYM